MDLRLFGDNPNQQAHSVLDAVDSRSSSHVETFLDSRSTVQHMPEACYNLSDNALGRQGNLLQVYGNSDVQMSAGASFLAGMPSSSTFVGSGAHLSDYLSEILSGTYTG
jgi:hypothetical protein